MYGVVSSLWDSSWLLSREILEPWGWKCEKSSTSSKAMKVIVLHTQDAPHSQGDTSPRIKGLQCQGPQSLALLVTALAPPLTRSVLCKEGSGW